MTKAIKLYPQYAIAYNNRGLAKYNLKDYRGAIDDYTKAIEIDPELYLTYTRRSIVLKIVGDLKGGCKDWKKAVDLGDTEPIEWVRNQC